MLTNPEWIETKWPPWTTVQVWSASKNGFLSGKIRMQKWPLSSCVEEGYQPWSLSHGNKAPRSSSGRGFGKNALQTYGSCIVGWRAETSIIIVKLRAILQTWLPEFSNARHENTSFNSLFEMVDIWFVQTPVCVSSRKIRVFPAKLYTSSVWFYTIKSNPCSLKKYHILMSHIIWSISYESYHMTHIIWLIWQDWNCMSPNLWLIKYETSKKLYLIVPKVDIIICVCVVHHWSDEVIVVVISNRSQSNWKIFILLVASWPFRLTCCWSRIPRDLNSRYYEAQKKFKSN